MRKEKIKEFAALQHLASTKLEPKAYEHALRVMQYVMANPLIPEEIHDDCIAAAIGHDLLEDTKLTVGQLPCSTNVVNAIQLLTKAENEGYVAYIKNIKSHMCYSSCGQIAYWVKMADMKDHLAQKATLTDRLKEKYLEALPFLLP